MSVTGGARKLVGMRIVVTQAAQQAGALCADLAGRGAHPLPYPCIVIEPPDESDARGLDDALRCAAAGGFDWLVITSANTATMLANRLAGLSLSATDLSSLSIAAVGTATAQAIGKALGLEVALIAQEQQAEGVAAALLTAWRGQGSGQRVLLPQANLARPVLAQLLRTVGAQVNAVTAYRTGLGRGGVNLPDLLAAGQVDVVTFTSSSTVFNCFERLRREGGDFHQLVAVRAVCIGPITGQTARLQGFDDPIVAQRPGMASLVDALETFWSEER